MCRIVFLILSALVLFSPLHAQSDLPPYIYYYAATLNAFVIERADGSDSRMFGQDITPPEADFIMGAGWSPDGKWFAWNAYGMNGAIGGYVLRVGDGELLKVTQDWVSTEMNWGPDGKWLLMRGYKKTCFYSVGCSLMNFLLIDVEADRVLATFAMDIAPGGEESLPIQWSPEDKSVIFYANEEYAYPDLEYYRITMQFDGTVIKQKLTQKEHDAIGPLIYSEYFNYRLSDSPSGRYKIIKGVFEDTVTGHPISFPVHSDATSSPLAMKWHSSEKWLLLNYDRTVSGGNRLSGVSIMSLDGTVMRELGDCGGLASPCVDWLPPQVNVADLSPGQVSSVLAAPAHYDYADEPVWGILPGTQSYILACDPESNMMIRVEDASSREVVYTFQNGETCVSSDMAYDFPFTFSPDHKLFAANAYPIGGESRTAIYDATTGERLVVLNDIGWDLSFSPDGKVLTMRTVLAYVAWDVEKVLHSVVPKSEATDSP